MPLVKVKVFENELTQEQSVELIQNNNECSCTST
jgi:phenylpyruvate tautomerase PptA (4-oxalocrotonate tautomerase family)